MYKNTVYLLSKLKIHLESADEDVIYFVYIHFNILEPVVC